MVTLTKDKYTIKFYSPDVTERRIVKSALRILHPERYNMPKYNERKSNGDRIWDGYVRFFDGYTFSIGLLDMVLKELKLHEIDIKYVGFKSEDLSWVKFSEGVSAQERDYQRNSILAFLDKKLGVIKVPTRGGKTYIAGETIRLITEKHPNYVFLFLTDSKDGFIQNVRDLAKFLGKNDKEIGTIREKERNYAQINVAMIQTIQAAVKRKEKSILDFFKKVNVLIIDEVHEFYSAPRQDVIKKIKKNSTYLLSISATPFRKNDPIGTLSMKQIIGDLVYDIHQKELEKRGVLAKNKVLLIINEIKPKDIDSNMPYFDLIEKHIHNSEKRNNILKIVVELCDLLKLKTLIMFASKKHGYHISIQLEKAFLSGDDDLNMRELIKNNFLEREGEVLLVSQIWKKAITLPEVEVFVNADGGKEDTLITQKKGRVLGVTDKKKKALVIDIIDVCSNEDTPFSNHSLSRIEVYEDSNTEDEIDTMENDEELRENLLIYLKEWFNG